MMIVILVVIDWLKSTLLTVASLMAGLLLWEYCLPSSDGYSLMPTPSTILITLKDLLYSGELQLHACASIKRLVPGWLSGVCLGWLTGIIIGLSVTAFRITIPWLVLLFPVPKIALFPAFILLFGIGESARIATIFAGVFFPVVYCVWQSVRSVPEPLMTMGKSFGLCRMTIICKIIIPSSLPGVFLSCRLTIALALVLLLAAEMLGANYGIGALIVGAGAMAQLDQLFAGVTVLSFFALILFFMLALLEKRCLHWLGPIRLW